MRQTKKSGIKEFFITLLVIFVIIVFSSFVRIVMTQYPIFADILCLILLCVWGFFVLTHYSARFHYICDGKTLKINRVIGKRNREIEFLVSSIKSISSKKPQIKYIYNFSPKILPGKNTKYIVFEHNRLEQAVVIEADADMCKYLKQFKKID